MDAVHSIIGRRRYREQLGRTTIIGDVCLRSKSGRRTRVARVRF